MNVTPAMRVAANARHHAMMREIAHAMLAGEHPAALIAERQALDAALYRDSFPAAYPAAEVEAARALIIEVTS